MKNFACLLAVLAACSKTESPSPPPSPAIAPPPTVVAPVAPSGPPVRFVAWTQYGDDEANKVRFFTATATSLVLERTVTVGDHAAINDVVWYGADPIVRYDENRVGRITDKGFEAFPEVPAAKWSKKRPAGMEDVNEEWSLDVTSKGVFLGYCHWGAKGYDDRDECNHTEHVRVFPGKLVRMEPGYDPLPEIPAVAVPTKTSVKSIELETGLIIACTRDGKTVEIPDATDPDRAYGMGGDLEWLSTEPAVFRVTAYSAGDPTTERIAVFEDCEETGYVNATRGPHGVFALLGGFDTPSAIRRDGRELGTVPESRVTFAP
jgi:hypothetical protein